MLTVSDEDPFLNTGDESLNRRRKAILEIMDFQTQVSLGIVLGPLSPALAMKQGRDRQEIVASSIAAGLETYLLLQYLGGGTSMTTVANFRKYLAFKGAVGITAAVAVPAISVVGAQKYVSSMERMAPSDPAQKSAFMNSVAAGIAGTFGGMTLG